MTTSHVHVYRFTDTSAPVLSGTAGALTNLLDKILVTGYGTQPPAGWSIAFTATNMRDYKMSTVSPALGYTLDVNDNGPGAGTFKEARVRGFETITGIAAGTNPFPTTTQQPAGLFVRKSVSLDSVARPWLAIADERTFYLFMQTGDTAGSYLCWGFGEIYSYRLADKGRCILLARSTENSAATAPEPLPQTSSTIGTTGAAGTTTRYLARPFDQEIAPTNVTSILGDGSFGAANSLDFTNASDNHVYVSQLRLSENSSGSTGSLRGRIRGLWQWIHVGSVCADGDTFTGSGDLAHRTFLVLKSTFSTAGSTGVLALEISSTWDTNSS